MWEPKPISFAVMVSGEGTNARALLERASERPDLMKARYVVSDRPGVRALAVAEEFGVPSLVIQPNEEQRLLEHFSSMGCQWAFLAGYKRIVSERFLEFFFEKEGSFSRVMNIHPSLLPAFPGLGAYKKAFHAGVKISGVTVHLVDSGMDTGLAVLQESFVREENDTLESFEAKGRLLEKKLFPIALDLVAQNRIRVVEKFGSRLVSLEER